MRMVFSFASISRSFFSIPGSSPIATKSPSFWNMLIGGKLPMAAVPRPIQSLAIFASRARCSIDNASKGSLKPANIAFLHGLSQGCDFPCVYFLRSSCGLLGQASHHRRLHFLKRALLYLADTLAGYPILQGKRLKFRRI